MTDTQAASAHAPVDPDLLRAAQSGDRAAFDRLFSGQVPKLRAVLRRLVGTPDDVDDLAQQTLLRAFEKIGSFRGEASPSTWLCSVGSRLALDYLRQKKRWREEAQSIFAHFALQDPDIGTAVGQAMMSPQFSYDVNEHVAYCFTCLGRSLEPELHLALVLRDVLELKNEEAAGTLNMSVSTFRHRLAEAREQMQNKYEHLCALVNKQGICWQCSGLREASPEGKRGPDVPTSLDWEGRLRLVRGSLTGEGSSRPMHDVFFRFTQQQEEQGRGSASDTTECGRPPQGDGK